MPTPSHVLVDTGLLWDIKHPDFQKVVQLSRERHFKIVVPYIVWEERRTQLLDDELDGVKKLQSAYERLDRRKADSILGRLTLPPFSIWDLEQIVEASKAHMIELAQKNNIEVLPLDANYAERAWDRYFEVHAPFRREESRDNRRKDIPDSWIFEAAIDLAGTHNGLVALCGDGKLGQCFESIGIQIFKTASELLAFLDQDAPRVAQSTSVAEVDVAAVGGSAEVTQLDVLMNAHQRESRDAEQKILGLVGYLGALPKRDLETMLEYLGVSAELRRNAAERLVLSGLIQDTGSTYVPKNRQACELAAAAIEPLMIGLVVKP